MNEFKEGRILFEADIVDNEKIKNILKNFGEPKDGFIAFSNQEFRVNDVKFDIDLLIDNKRIENFYNAEGYLMELDIWKNNETEYYELYLERYNSKFYYNFFHLTTENFSNINENYNLCYYTIHKKVYKLSHIPTFKNVDLNAIEVIIPDKRITIFLTI